jgi:uncharacterized protein (TIGR02217 family)
MSFLETPVFPIDIAYESEGWPAFKTEIVELFSGFEQRNGSWEEARRSFEASSGIHTEADLYSLLSFFHAVGGRLHGFRFPDWSDYKSCAPSSTLTDADQVIVADATAGQTTAQLTKTYTAGSLSAVRDIKKPRTGTVVLSKNGVAWPAAGAWSIDTATGIVTFNAPGLTLHDVVRAGFEFDVPCRFDVDKLPRKFTSYQIGEVSVPIVEVRL